MLYMVTFTINIPPMLAYIPYMDPMGIYIYMYTVYSSSPNWIEEHVEKHLNLHKIISESYRSHLVLETTQLFFTNRCRISKSGAKVQHECSTIKALVQMHLRGLLRAGYGENGCDSAGEKKHLLDDTIVV